MDKIIHRTVRLVAADDHQLFLEGLNSLFQLSSVFDLVATCSDGDSLLELIEQEKPDVALVDISMPGASAEEIVATVERNGWHTQLVALTMHHDPKLAEALLNLGMSGYILKEGAFDELMNAITDVINDEQYISPELFQRMQDYQDNKQQSSSLLTIREAEVLASAARGSSNKVIAREMDISERTVRFHVSNCCLKLDANGRSNAVAKAMQMSLINLDC